MCGGGGGGGRGRVRACVVGVVVKHPGLPYCVVDVLYRNPLHYYYYIVSSMSLRLNLNRYWSNFRGKILQCSEV